MDGFKRFDVVEDVSDHFYLWKDSNKYRDGADPFNARTNAYKRIMREWKLLEEGLPDSIFVRCYESRIDLLRAVIVGAAGTPYHDGLFFFDISFPSEYPAKPPKVNFRSNGYRINPNLYASGTVCLSLLNTWIGLTKERWNQSESSILQILVSIQALILNEKPYYNEPGNGIIRHGKRSRAYNEDVFLLSCKLMMFSQRNPPKNFEAFVADHFRKRAVAILSACEAYTNGRVPVGQFRDVASASSPAASVQISTRFKEGMTTLYPVLASYFRKNGASLEPSIQKLNVETKATVNRGKKVGMIQKMIEKIKKFLRSKKKNDPKNKSIEAKVK